MPFSTLTSTLQQFTRRRRQRDALIWVPRGLLAGLLIAVIVAAWARTRPLLTNGELAVIALGLSAAGMLIAAIVLLLQRISLTDAAAFADRQFGLQERATTAVELQTGLISTSAEITHQQLNDANAATRQVNLKRDLPYKIKRQDWALILLAVGLLLAAILPNNPQVPALLQQRAAASAVAEQSAALETIATEIQQNDALTPAQQEQLLEPVEQALEEFNEGGLTQEEAVAVLSETEAALRDLESSLADPSLQETLQSAGQSLAQHEQSQALGEALASGDLAQAAAEAAQLADQLDSLDPAAQAQLAQDLAASAETLAQTDSQLSQQMANAADALASGNTDAAQDALQDAAATLQERNQELAQNQQAAQQAQSAADQVNQSRSEVAQAGQPQPADSGQPGQPPAAGSQSGQQSQQGQGQPGQSATTANTQPGQSGSESSGQGSAVGGPSQGGSSTDNVFVPDFVDLSGIAGVDVELDATCRGAGDECGELQNETPTEFSDEGGSIVPYTQVFGDYRGAVNEALSDNSIPLGYKQFIRDYFSSLEPEE